MDYLVADIPVLIFNACRCRIADNIVERLSETSVAKWVTIGGLEQKNTPVAKLAAVRAETQHSRCGLESQVAVFEVT